MEVEYYIQHKTTTVFKRWQRLRIMLGANLVIDSEIAVDKAGTPVYSTAKDHLEGGLINKIKKLWHERRELITRLRPLR